MIEVYIIVLKAIFMLSDRPRRFTSIFHYYLPLRNMEQNIIANPFIYYRITVGQRKLLLTLFFFKIKLFFPPTVYNNLNKHKRQNVVQFI